MQYGHPKSTCASEKGKAPFGQNIMPTNKGDEKLGKILKAIKHPTRPQSGGNPFTS